MYRKKNLVYSNLTIQELLRLEVVLLLSIILKKKCRLSTNKDKQIHYKKVVDILVNT